MQPKDQDQFENQFNPDYFQNFEDHVQNYPIINEFVNLRIMSYNVWFDDFNRQNRYEAIVQMILASNANVLCLQECTTHFIKMLVQNKKVVQKYPHFGIQEFHSFYGVMILSQWPPANVYEYTYNNVE